MRNKITAAILAGLAALPLLAITWTTDVSKAISTGSGSATKTWTYGSGSYSLTYNTSGVTPGTWTSDFAAAKKYADTYNIPMLVYVGAADCGYCRIMKSTGLTSASFKSWVASHPIVLVFLEYSSSSAISAAFKSDEVTFVYNSSGLLPLMRAYWKQSSGTVVGKAFSGRVSKMPSKEGSTCSSQLVGTLNTYFGSWDNKLPSEVPDYAGGYFMVRNTAYARLETVRNKTTRLVIPMYRTATTAATNKLKVGSGSLVTISWAANETTKYYTHTLTSAEKAQAAGTTIALTLYDSDGTTVKSTSAINVVNEPETSTSNPKWLGEGVNYGEWTMDYDTAKTKGGYVLAQFGGALWCPDCYGVDNSLFKSGSKFYTWAQENNVALVVFDQGNGDSKTPAGTGGARLLTYTEGNCYYISGTPKISGASYLSRKGISQSAAANRIAQTTKYTVDWKSPDSTAVRMANPEIVLVKNDKVVARFNAYEDSSKVFDVTENLARLNALLTLADSNDAGDTDDFFATATQTLAIEDDADGSLQINNPKKFYKLTNVPAGKVTFTSTGITNARASVKPTLTVYDGSLSTVLGTGSGSVTVTFANGSNKYLAVSYFDNATTTKFGSTTSVDYDISSTVTLVPSSTSASFKTRSGSMKMTVTKGTKYKLANFASSSYSNFTKNSDGSYTANTTGDIAMTATAGATVTYQIWITGTVQFATTSANILETAGTGTISVTRTGGSSGTATATVSVNAGSLGTKRVTVSPATLTWASGDAAAKTVTYKVTADDTYRADETFTISLAAAASSSSSVGSNSSFTLKVTDSDDPVLPASSYSRHYYEGIAVSETYAVSNIKESDSKVNINRDGKLPGGLKLTYSKSAKTLTLSGRPKAAGTFTFTVSVTERRSTGRATGNETKFTIVVSDTAALTAGQAGYNALLKSGLGKKGTLPVYGKLSGKTVLAGTIEFKITSAMKISAKYYSVTGEQIIFSGSLTGLTDAGVATATLSKGNAKLLLNIASNGRVYSTLSGSGSPYGTVLVGESDGTNILSRPSDYSGYYTVTLPVDESASSLTKASETIATGTGYVILKANAASFKNTGKVTYKGMLSNGQAFTGSAYISGDQVTEDGYTWAYLPVLVRNKKNNQAGFVLKIRKNAKSDYTDAPQVVFSSSSATPFWKDATNRAVYLNAYGDYYDTSSASLAECCENFYNKTTFNAVFDTTWFSPSTSLGTIVTLPTATATVSETGTITIANKNADCPLKLKLQKSTGLVSGTANAVFSSGKRKNLKIFGALLIGWADCGCAIPSALSVERPVFSGTAYYKDGTTIRGFAIELE